ncbi:MAG TPA: hypothetical protein DCQ64_01705 [Candidatus Rokubacteria bacterium]|nr:hypothetical protein [Candidatus Rokubacteria bacterium]
MRLDESIRLVAEDLVLALDPAEIMRRSGYRPDPWQLDFLEAREPRVFVLSPRQRGKSTVTAAKVGHRMLFVPGTKAVIVSRSLAQAREWMKRLKELYRPFAGRWPVKSETAGSLEIVCPSAGRRVSECISVPRGDSGRGYSPTLLVIDEAGFHTDEDMSIVLPTVEATGGDIIALTTPSPQKSDRRWARSVWDSGAGWRRINVTPEACPRFVLDPEEQARKRNELGDARFRREHLGEWFDEDDPGNPRLASREASARLRARLAGGTAGDDDGTPPARES